MNPVLVLCLGCSVRLVSLRLIQGSLATLGSKVREEVQLMLRFWRKSLTLLIVLPVCLAALPAAASGREARQQPPPGGGPALPPAAAVQESPAEDGRLRPGLRSRGVAVPRQRHLQPRRQPADPRRAERRRPEARQPQRRAQEVRQEEVRNPGQNRSVLLAGLDIFLLVPVNYWIIKPELFLHVYEMFCSCL